MDKQRVLVVDDDPQITRMLERFLLSTGRFEVRTENRAPDAVQAARAFRPDVILLDVIMPGADGGEVAAAIAEDPEMSSTPIIFLTGLVTPTEISPAGTDIAGRTFLPKPIQFDRLLQRLELVAV